MQITDQNVEELILLYIDGALEPEAVNDLLKYADNHPSCKALLEEYRQTVLVPDPAVAYDNKDDLLRPETKTILIRPKPAAIAAAVILLLLSALGIKSLKTGHGTDEAGRIAKSHTGPAQIAPNPLPVPATVVPVRQPAARVIRRPLQQQKRYRSPVPDDRTRAARITEQDKTPVQPEIEPLPSQRMIRVEQRIELRPPVMAITPPATEPLKKPNSPQLPEWLPLEQERLEPVNELIAQFREMKERLATSGRTLKNASFALKIGEKEIGFGKKHLN